MGEGQYECEIKGCKGYSSRTIVNMSEEHYSGDCTVCATNDRFCLCVRHANHFWGLLKGEVEAHDAREINDGIDS